MGIVFFFLFWLTPFLVLASCWGLMALLLAWLLCKKERRGRKMLLAFCTPALAMFTYGMGSLAWMALVAATLHTDLGIGDSWRAPLRHGYELAAVDLPEQAEVCKADGEVVLDGIDQVELRGDSLLGTAYGDYFIFNLRTSESRTFTYRADFLRALPTGQAHLVPSDEFFWEVKKYPYLVGGVLCLLLTIGVVRWFWRSGMGNSVRQTI